MPTYEQLNQEAAYRNEYMPEPMRWFCRELATALGVPQQNVGAKGDNLHLNGGHRSQRWILTSRWCTNRTYTVWGGLPAHLMDALGAIDVTPASREQLLTICRRLDAAMRAGLIEEVVAYYGNTDNDTRVDGYDNIRNAVASSDSSHLWHLHMTLNRWAVASLEMYQRLLRILLGQPLEDDMSERLEWFAHQFETLETHYPPNVMDGRETKFLTSYLQLREDVANIKADLAELNARPPGAVSMSEQDKADIIAGLAAAVAPVLAAQREAMRKAFQAGAIVFDNDPGNDPPV